MFEHLYVVHLLLQQQIEILFLLLLLLLLLVKRQQQFMLFCLVFLLDGVHLLLQVQHSFLLQLQLLRQLRQFELDLALVVQRHYARRWEQELLLLQL